MVKRAVDETIARSILGDANVFGPSSWAECFPEFFRFTKQERETMLAELTESNASIAEFEAKRESHFLIYQLAKDAFGQPLTLVRFNEIRLRAGLPLFFRPYTSLDDESFAKKTVCRSGWHLMRKDVLPGSEGRTYDLSPRPIDVENGYCRQDCTQVELLARIAPDEEVPLAVEEVIKLCCYFARNKLWLHPLRCARCQDIASYGATIYVGGCSNIGVALGCATRNASGDILGLATTRRLGRVSA